MDKFLKDYDTNSGLTILVRAFHNNASETREGMLFDIAILNHTDEAISFSNVAYGLRIFTPNETTNEWLEIKTMFSFGNEETLIKGGGMNVGDYVSLLYSDFNTLVPEKLTICVFGNGTITHKKYAAYTELLRQK